MREGDDIIARVDREMGERLKQPREKFPVGMLSGHQSHTADVSAAGRAEPPIAGVAGSEKLMEEPDQGAAVPLLGDHQVLDVHRLKERVRSLTADSVSLGQQLVREKKQNKSNEVRWSPNS